MKEILLTQGFVTLVDDIDFEWLSQWNWWVYNRKKDRTQYAIRHLWRNGIKTSTTMHQEILKPPEGMVSDHINGSGLDNRRENLRICTPSHNCMNRKPQKGTSVYKGVSIRDDGRWRARIKTGGKIYHLGIFVSEIEAAIVYDNAAKEIFGEFARLNIQEALL